jgi:hypothetical protein
MLRVIDMLEQWQPLCENTAAPSPRWRWRGF